jgi:ABC-type branched-subunit amino acid transport system ATPase component/ABC-type branched-subunit amino acid transport system permease subunit
MQYVQFALLGLATGSLYALVALAVVLSYRASGVLNFSAGAVGALGAFVTFKLRDGDLNVPWQLAVLAGLVTGALLGAATQVLIMRVLRNASVLSKSVATLGVFTFVQGFIVLAWPDSQNSQVATIPTSLLPDTPDDLVHPFGQQQLTITKDRLIIIAMVVVLTVILRVVYSKTLFGLATSAVAENAEAAAAGGLSTSAIELTNFVVAGVLSAGAAILLAPIIGLTAVTLSLIIIPAMAAALLGRFSSFALTVVGAGIIGVLQAEITRFVHVDKLTGLSDAVPVLLIVVVTVIGGKSRLTRGDIVSTLPFPGSGRVKIGRVVVGIAIVGATCVLVNDSFASTLSIMFATATLILSLVVVVGYAGQLSLGQAAFAGFGAWLAAKLFLEAGIPLELAIVLAVLVTVPVGLLVAVPALRTRGITLAIATLALGALIQSLILNNGALTGGFTGFDVADEKFLGVAIDPIKHPQAYAMFVLGGFVVAGLLVANVRRGRTGRRLLAVRSNERAASALGIGVYGAKLYGFGLASAIAAIAGVLIAFQANYINLGQFNVLTSITAVEYAVIGGIGWISGAVLGSFGAPGAPLAYLLSSQLDFANWILPLAGLGTVLVIARAPDGLAAQIAEGVVARPRAPMARVLRGMDSLGREWRTREGPLEQPRDRARFEVEVRNVSVNFGGVAALDDVSFTIRPGEVLGLIGPNGAGKTTLLDTITGFTRQASGSVLLDGKPIDRWSPERRARAGLGRSWQSVELFEGMTVRENLLVAADDQSRTRYLTDLVRPGRLPRSDVVDQIVAALQLSDVLDERPAALPHGRARLVGLARAVVAEPVVLLLDEPAAGLDTNETEEFGAVIRMLADELHMGVVVVEHDVPLVTSTCDRIVVLDFGHQIAMGTPDEITANELVIGAYLGVEEPAIDRGSSANDVVKT